MARLRRRDLLPLPLLLAFPGLALASRNAPADFVHVRAGDLPIILTAPHGGEMAIPGVAPRDIAGKGERYVIGEDARTDRIAIGIADGLKALTGKSPYFVVARFHRKFIDANRPADVAFDSEASRPYYEHYHGRIRASVDELRGRFPNALLLDVHGQHKIRDSLVRGTINGKSVTRLLARAGFDSVVGPKGLFGQFEANGLKVFPSNSLPPMGRYEDAGLNGGYTVALYGSHRSDGIDAMQLEFGLDLRTPARLAGTIDRATRSIAAFHDAYLKTPGT